MEVVGIVICIVVLIPVAIGVFWLRLKAAQLDAPKARERRRRLAAFFKGKD